MMNTKVVYLLIIASIVLVYLIFEVRKSIGGLLGSMADMILKIVGGKMSPKEFGDVFAKKIEGTINHLDAFLKLALFLVLLTTYLLLVKAG